MYNVISVKDTKYSIVEAFCSNPEEVGSDRVHYSGMLLAILSSTAQLHTCKPRFLRGVPPPVPSKVVELRNIL